jgi:large subunit ribosomal protein L30
MSETRTTGQRTTGLKVTLVRSRIGIKLKQRGTLRALGLHRIGSTNTLPDRPEVRGMLARVPHLVRVEELS